MTKRTVRSGEPFLEGDPGETVRVLPEGTQRIEKAASEFALARRKLEKEIRWARTAGMPLRVIAEAARMSHEQVRRMTR